MAEYIDREAFIADKRWLYCTDCDKRKGKKRGKYVTLYEIGEAPCKSCWANDMLDEIEVYPAANVAPVRHGRWKPFDTTYGRSVYYCTACEHSAVVPTALGKPIFNYCPTCGADMREQVIGGCP